MKTTGFYAHRTHYSGSAPSLAGSTSTSSNRAPPYDDAPLLLHGVAGRHTYLTYIRLGLALAVGGAYVWGQMR